MRIPTVHELKSWPESFELVLSGIKTFELRRNDRSYQEGDLLLLKEWLPEEYRYTGGWVLARVVHMIDAGERFGTLLAPQCCVLGIEVLKAETTL